MARSRISEIFDCAVFISGIIFRVILFLFGNLRDCSAERIDLGRSAKIF